MKIEHVSDYRTRRAALYPSMGDQLGAITDALASLHAAGATLPASTVAILDQIASVKATLPKPKRG